MGMYTELIFGAELKQDTPTKIIEAVQCLIGMKDNPVDFPFDSDYKDLFCCSSYYFGVTEAVNKMWYDDISKSYHVSIRSNIKDYDNEIEKFLQWVKPYIESGSGLRNMYAIVMYEEQEKPTLYYLDDAD